jgi:hypothetical protein
MTGTLRVAAVSAAVFLCASSACLADNLEVVVREGNHLVHYWAELGKEWNRGGVVTSRATGPGAVVARKTP